MNSKVLVTGYQGPDLDGVACSLGYSELLKINDINAKAGVYGKPHREAQFVMNQIGINIPRVDELEFSFEEIRLVDASDKRGISDQIEPSMVTKVIDHRKDYDPDAFPNADLQIEFVGAAATLIAEKYKKCDVTPIEEISTLLYTAIISNTLNLQANVTTERDEKMATWLKDRVDTEQIVDRMFEHKSDINEEKLGEVFKDDFATISENNKKIGIVQLEIVDVKEFFNHNKSDIIQTIKLIRTEKNLDMIVVMGVDVREGYDVLVSPNDQLISSLQSALDVNFSNQIATTEEPIMRKELIPQLRSEL